MSSIATLPVPVGWPDSLSNNVDEQVDRIKRWLELFIEPGQVSELRAVDVINSRGRNYEHTEAGFYDDLKKMAAEALSLTHRATGTYFIPNPLKQSVLAKCCNRVIFAKQGSQTDDLKVKSRKWIYIDVDPENEIKCISATEEEKSFAVKTSEDARNFLCECGWSSPVVIDSGNGRHLYYAIDLPRDDNDLVHNILKALANRFNTPNATVDLRVKNPARIMKIPGTLSRKGDQIQGRIHRRAFVVEVPPNWPQINDLSLLERVAGAANRVVEHIPENPWHTEVNGVLPVQVNVAATNGHVATSQPILNGQVDPVVALAKDIRSYLAKVPGAVAGQDGHGQTFHVACILTHDFNLSEAEAMEYIREWNSTCSPPWAEHELVHKVKDAAGKPGPRGRLLRSRESKSDPSAPKPIAVDWSKTDRRTDVWNAQRMVSHHGQDILYCPQWKKWYCWDGCRWTKDETHQIEYKAKQSVMTLYEEVNNAATGLEKTQWLQWAIKSEESKRINSMVALARSEPGVSVLPSEFDKSPWLLNCQNGTLNLQTSSIASHCRNDRLTKMCPVTHDPESGCPTWDRFLQVIFNGDGELIEFMQRAAGYALCGDTKEQVIFFLYGTGKNGKSTFLETLQLVLGDYALAADFSTFIEKQKDSVGNDIARLKGARFVSAIEAGEGKRLAETVVKQLTGGDKIAARYLYSEHFEFVPECKIFLAANHKPAIRGTDLGIWRRIKLVPFEVVIPESERIKNMQEVLFAERSGILNWCLKGLLQWHQTGLAPPEKVEAATGAYQLEMDAIARFLDECCQRSTSPEVFADNTKIYRAYQIWCMAEGDEPMKHRSFTKGMKDHGFEQSLGTNGHRKWPKIMLKPEWMSNVENGSVENSGQPNTSYTLADADKYT